MALEKLDKEIQVVGYNSDVSLVAKGVNKNHQGMTLEDVSYVKFAKDADGVAVNEVDIILTDSTLKRGKILFTKDLKLAVVRKSYGRFDGLPNVTLAGTAVEAGTPVYPADATYNNITFTKKSDSSVKLNGQIIIAAGAISSIKITGDEDNPLATHDWQHDFVVGDVLVVADGWSGSATGFEIALVAADVNATVVSTSALS